MKVYIELTSIEKVDSFIEDNSLAIVYISRTDCSVCHALFPKIRTLLAEYPKIKLGFVVADKVEDIASKFTIFSVPTIIFMVDGKEYIRESRFISVEQLEEKIGKIYDMYLDS